jgi:hypothetical protein
MPQPAKRVRLPTGVSGVLSVIRTWSGTCSVGSVWTGHSPHGWPRWPSSPFYLEHALKGVADRGLPNRRNGLPTRAPKPHTGTVVSAPRMRGPARPHVPERARRARKPSMRVQGPNGGISASTATSNRVRRSAERRAHAIASEARSAHASRPRRSATGKTTTVTAAWTRASSPALVRTTAEGAWSTARRGHGAAVPAEIRNPKLATGRTTTATHESTRS